MISKMRQLLIILTTIILATSKAFTQTDDILFQKGKLTKEEKKYDSATFYFNEFIKSETDKNKKALAYLELALIQSELKKPTEGIKLVDKSIELDQQYIYYFYRGRLNYQNQKIANAIKDYDKSIELKPDHGASYTWRGIAKYWKAKTVDGCKDITKGAELGDEHAKGLIPKLCK